LNFPACLELLRVLSDSGQAREFDFLALTNTISSMNDYDYNWRDQEETTEEDDNTIVSRDVDGKELHDGDSVHIIKDLKAKGISKPLKRGTKFRIRLTADPDEVECKISKSTTLVLRTEFLKKA